MRSIQVVNMRYTGCCGTKCVRFWQRRAPKSLLLKEICKGRTRSRTKRRREIRREEHKVDFLNSEGDLEV